MRVSCLYITTPPPCLFAGASTSACTLPWVQVGVGGVALWPSVWTYLHLKESFAGKATGAEVRWAVVAASSRQ